MSKPGLKIAKNLTLPLDVLALVQAMVANRGRGKTYAAGKLMEEAVRAGVQSVAIDPTGVWWGLQSSASGEGVGLDVLVMGGEHGDVPLERDAGEIVARYLVESGYSAVLDLSLMRKTHMHAFTADFLETLYRLKARGKHKTTLHLFWDETEKAAPQSPGKDQLRVLGAAEDCVKLGRSRGLGMTLITQRPAALNKNLLELAEVYYLFGTVGRNDRKAILDQVKVDAHPDTFAQLSDELAKIPAKHCYVWSPTLEVAGSHGVFQKVKIAAKRTFDSSRTPRPGEVRREPAVRRKVDLDKLSAEIAAAAERAKDNDPAELRKRIKQLEGEAKKRGAQVDQQAMYAAIAAEKDRLYKVWEADLAKFNAEWEARFRERVGELTGRLAKIEQLAHVNGDGGEVDVPTPPKPASSPPPSRRPESKPVAARPARAESAASGETSSTTLNATMRKMLVVMIQRQRMGKATTDDRTVAALAGIKRTGGTFSTYLSRMRSAGYLEGERSSLHVTEAGVAAAGDVDELPTGQRLLDWWKSNKLNATQGAILDVLVDAWPDAVARSDLAEHVGLTAGAGTFSTYLSRMRGMTLIEGKSDIRATDALMEGVKGGGHVRGA